MPDGVFVDNEDRLAFALHPVPTSADVLAILDRIVRRIARRLADEACDDSLEEGIGVVVCRSQPAENARAFLVLSSLVACQDDPLLGYDGAHDRHGFAGGDDARVIPR